MSVHMYNHCYVHVSSSPMYTFYILKCVHVHFSFVHVQCAHMLMFVHVNMFIFLMCTRYVCTYKVMSVHVYNHCYVHVSLSMMYTFSYLKMCTRILSSCTHISVFVRIRNCNHLRCARVCLLSVCMFVSEFQVVPVINFGSVFQFLLCVEFCILPCRMSLVSIMSMNALFVVATFSAWVAIYTVNHKRWQYVCFVSILFAQLLTQLNSKYSHITPVLESSICFTSFLCTLLNSVLLFLHVLHPLLLNPSL